MRLRHLALPSALLGVLLIGYAPFLHAFNAIYYPGMLAPRAAGTLWLSWGTTLAVPLLGCAFVEIARALSAGARRDDANDHRHLDRGAWLLAAAALVSVTPAIMAPEVWRARPGEGVHFDRPSLHELASPLWLGIAVLAVILGSKLGESAAADAALPSRNAPSPSPTARGRVLTAACWAATLTTIPSMGGEFHFDVPSAFVRVIELYLCVWLASTWRPHEPRAPRLAIVRVLVLADLTRVLLTASITPLVFGRASYWTMYERHLFTAGRYVAAAVHAPLTAALALLLGWWIARTVRRRPMATLLVGTATRASASRRSARARRLTRIFLLAHATWLATSATLVTLLAIVDATSGHDDGLGESWRAGIGGWSGIPVIQLGATWVMSLAVAHWMASTAIALAPLGADALARRARSDDRAWLGFGAALGVLIVSVLARLAAWSLHLA